ncbi:MAG: hypothetical protein RQ842_09095 [Vulcanisaeta sp.]|nr:hypothetical protein [Vulcanisaeta sp.]
MGPEEVRRRRVEEVVVEKPRRSAAVLNEALEQSTQESANTQTTEQLGGAEPITEGSGAVGVGEPMVIPINVLDVVDKIESVPVDSAVSVRSVDFRLNVVNLEALINPKLTPVAGLAVDGEPRVTVKSFNEPWIMELPLLTQQFVAALGVNDELLVSTVRFDPPRVLELPLLPVRVSAAVDEVDSSVPTGVLTRILEAVGVSPEYSVESILDLGLTFDDRRGNRVGGAFTFNCEGTTVVIYSDEYRDKGLDESLALIAVELERIVCGKSYDPRFIDLNDEDEVRDLEVLIRDEGVYVIRGDVKDDKQRNKVGRVFNRFFGYNPKIVIMSEGLAKNFILKPSLYVRVSEVRPEVLNVLARAYTGFATGPYCDDIPQELDALATARLCYTTRVRETVRWVLENAPDRLRPSVGGGESETHMNLKALVIRYLLESGRNFKVEDEITECKPNVPDIYVADEGIAIDVKASIGSLPTNDIVEAHKKYSGCANEVWVVFRPFTVLAFTKPILRTLENLELKLKVKVPLYNPQKGLYELVDIADFLNSVYEHLRK